MWVPPASLHDLCNKPLFETPLSVAVAVATQRHGVHSVPCPFNHEPSAALEVLSALIKIDALHLGSCRGGVAAANGQTEEKG